MWYQPATFILSGLTQSAWSHSHVVNYGSLGSGPSHWKQTDVTETDEGYLDHHGLSQRDTDRRKSETC